MIINVVLYVAEYRSRLSKTRWLPCPWYARGFVGDSKHDVQKAIELYGAHDRMEYRVMPYLRGKATP